MKKILTVLCFAFIAVQANATEIDPCFGVYSYDSDSTSISFKFSIEGIDELRVDDLETDGRIQYDVMGVFGNAHMFRVIFADSQQLSNVVHFLVVLDSDDVFLLAPGYYLRYSFDESTNRSTVIKKESVSFDFEPERY